MRALVIGVAVAAVAGCTFDLHDVVSPDAGGGGASAHDGGSDPVDARNMTQNPSFESDTSFWTHIGSVLSREAAADAPNGSFVAHLALSGTPQYFGIRSDTGNIQTPSKAGATYCVTARVRSAASPPNPNATIAIYLFEETTTAMTEIASTDMLPLPSSFERIAATGVAATDGEALTVHISQYSPAPGDAFDVDLFQVVELKTGDPPCP